MIAVTRPMGHAPGGDLARPGGSTLERATVGLADNLGPDS
jgi:hypothetical protein